jgi:hypothetical protein
MNMRYTAGLLLFGCAAVLLWQGVRHRRHVLALASPQELAQAMRAASASPGSLRAFTAIARGAVLVALAWIGIKATLAYFWMDGGRFVSLFDLAGLLAMLAAWGWNVTVRTRFSVGVAEGISEARRARDGGADGEGGA